MKILLRKSQSTKAEFSVLSSLGPIGPEELDVAYSLNEIQFMQSCNILFRSSPF